MLYKDITDKIIKAFFTVYNTLGYGFLEKVYENALVIELQGMGFIVQQQQNIKVYYKNQIVGEYFADIMVNNIVALELKAAECLVEQNKAQLLNYLKATDKEVGLILNFGKKPEFERVIFTNDIKRKIVN